MAKKILIVEDEVPIARVLGAYLKKADYEVEFAHDGHQAVEKFEAFSPALVLLDVMMPGQDGWNVLAHIRKQNACPVIMITALSDVEYRLNGLHSGADDYITKPFIADEVVARVSAVLRRSSPIFESSDDMLMLGNLKVDFRAHHIFVDGEEVTLTPRDLSLLLFLLKHPNQTFSREQLIEKVWGIDFDGSDRAVDLAVKRIRKCLYGWDHAYGEIKTLRGLGYQFRVYKEDKE
ncbi:response regulator transcription factor [Longirhabdus pacifica]|uniref:response regulator transcription factor n=1 Tax=Longirhabdus pacifica TaxID=2305227 RepID=UPI001008A5D7|nr:response regulator transcription factor [Longirhabdus pacifica]